MTPGEEINGRNVVAIPRDTGNSLFEAFDFAYRLVTNREAPVGRREAVDWLRNHRREYVDYAAGTAPELRSQATRLVNDAALQEMVMPGTNASTPELWALANLCQVIVVVHLSELPIANSATMGASRQTIYDQLVIIPTVNRPDLESENIYVHVANRGDNHYDALLRPQRTR